MLKSIYIKTKNLMIKKNKGNITSLIYGQMFMLLLIIWAMFVFRTEMINLTFNYIDDAITDALLGSALANIEEYGRHNQVIIHDNDEYTKLTSDNTKGWNNYEAAILLSELNYGYDGVLHNDALSNKTILNKTSRATNYGVGTSISTGENGDSKDYYLNRSISAFIGNLRYNLSGGNVPGDYDSSKTVGSVDSATLNTTKAFNITHNVPNSTFLGSYLYDESEIDVTKFEIYSVYKATLAQRHVYKSDYMIYNTGGEGDKTATINGKTAVVKRGTKGTVNGTLNTGEELTVKGWNEYEPGYDTIIYEKAKEQFKNKYKPFKYLADSGYATKTNDEDGVKDEVAEKYRDKDTDYDTQVSKYCDTNKLNENYGTELIAYYRKLRNWYKDWYMYYITCDIKNNPDNKSLLKCFTNTYNTFQGKYETTDTDGNKKYKTTFNYFYTLNSTNLDQSPGNTSEADKLSDVIAQTNGVAPIVGYSVYAYDKESNTTTFEYTDQDTAVGSDKLIHYQTTITTKEGANIDNTSLYVQVKFQIKTIPGVWGMSFTPKAVTVSRLISIEPNE